MPALALSRGTPLLIEDRRFLVQRRLSSGVLQIEAEDDGELRNLKHEELAVAIASGGARIVCETGSARMDSIVAQRLEHDMTALPEGLRFEALRRSKYVKATIGLPRSGNLRAALEAEIQCVAGELAEKPPAVATVYRWQKLWAAASGDLRSLVPDTTRRGNRDRRLHPTVREIIATVISERYLTLERPSARSSYLTVVDRIAVHNRTAGTSEQLDLPSVRSFQREVKKLDRYEVMAAREGKRIADVEFRVVGLGPQTTRPLQRVECDHTKLDLFVVDDRQGIPVGRPHLTLLIDHYSRMPIGYYLGFEPPSRTSVMLALRHSILPKQGLREQYPEIENEWPCYGVPEVLVVDNGREFHSEDLEIAALQLNMEIQHAPVMNPWYKGVVERYFGAVNRKMLSEAPGKTFASIVERGDYDPRKNAVISLTLLHSLICKWIVDVHGRSSHEGIIDVPLERWLQGTAENPPRLLADARDARVLLSNTKERVLRREGIELQYLLYASERLVKLRQRLPKNARVTIKIDPVDLSEIYVLDPSDRSFFPVPAIDQPYAKGLGYWQHCVISRFARKMGAAKVDIIALARAKETIHRMIQGAVAERKKRVSAGTRAERFLERGGQEPLRLPAPIKPVQEYHPPVIDLGPASDSDWGADYDLVALRNQSAGTGR